MDMFLNILKQLGANESVFYQFGVIVCMYFITKFLFLDHLQKILETREDKTVNLEGNAEKKFKEISKIQDEYKEKIQTANKTIKQNVESKKAEIVRREETKYRSEETTVNAYIEEERKKAEADIQEKKDKVLAEAEQLANGLVQKITKEL